MYNTVIDTILALLTLAAKRRQRVTAITWRILFIHCQKAGVITSVIIELTMIFPIESESHKLKYFFLMCSLLKVILLQSSEVSDSVTETKPVDFISLSGVCLMNNRGTWRIQVQITCVHVNKE